MDHQTLNALRQNVLDAFRPVVESFKSAEDINILTQVVVDTVRTALSDASSEWNDTSSSGITSVLTDDALVACLSWLPYRDLVRAACVSRRWRSVAVSHSHLWAHVLIHRHVLSGTDEILQALIRRSSQPLDVTYYAEGGVDGMDSSINLDLFLQPYLGNIKYLKISARNNLFMDISGVSAPHLQVFDVSFSVNGLPDAPNLSNLAVREFIFAAIKTTYPQVTSFSGRVTGRVDAQTLFQLFPKLVTLNLQFSSSSNGNLPTVGLPRTLTHITLRTPQGFWPRQATSPLSMQVTLFIRSLRQHHALRRLEIDMWAVHEGLQVMQKLKRAPHNVDLSDRTVVFQHSDLILVLRNESLCRSRFRSTQELLHAALELVASDITHLSAKGPRNHSVINMAFLNLRSLRLVINAGDPIRSYIDMSFEAPVLNTLVFDLLPTDKDSQIARVVSFILNRFSPQTAQRPSLRLEELILNGFPERFFTERNLGSASVFSVTDTLRIGTRVLTAPVSL